MAGCPRSVRRATATAAASPAPAQLRVAAAGRPTGRRRDGATCRRALETTKTRPGEFRVARVATARTRSPGSLRRSAVEKSRAPAAHRRYRDAHARPYADE